MLVKFKYYLFALQKILIILSMYFYVQGIFLNMALKYDSSEPHAKAENFNYIVIFCYYSTYNFCFHQLQQFLKIHSSTIHSGFIITAS